MQRETIIAALLVQLGQISTANGYDTNIGANVKSSYEYDIDDDELPLVNVFEDGASVPQSFGPEWLISCPLRVDVIAIGTIAYARQCLNDVLKAIGRDKTIGGYCEDTEPGDFEMFHEESGKTYVAVTVGITLKYMTDEWRI